MFNKINKKLYVLINDNKFLNLNQRLNEENLTNMHIMIYNLMSHVAF